MLCARTTASTTYDELRTVAAGPLDRVDLRTDRRSQSTGRCRPPAAAHDRRGRGATCSASSPACTVDECEAAIQDTLLAGSRAQDPATGRPLFAFRLHQFLSKGDSVYVTLEPEDSRTSRRSTKSPRPAALTSCCTRWRSAASVDRSTPWSPERGAPRRRDLPRASRPRRQRRRHVRRLPLHLHRPPLARRTRSRRTGSRTRGSTATRSCRAGASTFRSASSVDASGKQGRDRAWHDGRVHPVAVHCSACAARSATSSTRGNDYSKLATLDREGRSSAVSVISQSIVRSLTQVPETELPTEARKLLTFVDNRQDASLQAGHFNDFVQVLQLRGAALPAPSRARQAVSTHEDVATRVVGSLGLEFARLRGQSRGGVRRERRTPSARSATWSSSGSTPTSSRAAGSPCPTLSRPACCTIGYVSLGEIAADEALWSSAYDPLRDTTAGPPRGAVPHRPRRAAPVLAVDVDCLTQDGFDRLSRQSRPAPERRCGRCRAVS